MSSLEVKIKLSVNWSAAFLQMAYEPDFGLEFRRYHVSGVLGRPLETPVNVHQLISSSYKEGEPVREALRQYAEAKNLALPISGSKQQWDRVAIYNANLVDWKQALRLLYPVSQEITRLSIVIDEDFINEDGQNVIHHMRVIAVDGEETSDKSITWWHLGSQNYQHDLYVGRTQARVIQALRTLKLDVPVIKGAKI